MTLRPTDVLSLAGLSPEAIDLLVALADDSPDGWRSRCPDRPTVADLTRMLACDTQDNASLRAALAGSSPLVELGFIALSGGELVSHEQREVRIDDRMIAFLHGDDALDRRLAGIAGLHRLAVAGDPTTVERISRALGSAGPITVEGPARIGKVSAAISAITAARAALVCDVPALVATDDPMSRLALVRREGMLCDARVVLRVREWDATWSAPLRRGLLELVEAGAVLAIRDGAPVVRELRGVRRITVPMPSAAAQTAIWRGALGDLAGLEQVAARYPLPPGDIVIAAADVRAETELVGRTAIVEDALVAARLQVGHRLGDVAELVSTTLTWNDVVLRNDVATRVRELIDAVRLRDRVMVDWGFETKLPYGRSISALLSGPPGTGKTMVSTILGKELGLEVFRVDLSKVVSKFIGETEKNLARVFDEAARCRAILLFDEADSLFAKRTEVRTSNDKFANLEVNFLLQRLESHDGVVLLTTNAATAIDRAFIRRIRYRIEFPEPEAAERTRLWRSLIPTAAPLAPDIDFAQLGRRFPISGGHIKNAVVRAAYRVMTEGRVAIDQEALVGSALAEWTELGNLTPPPDASPSVEPSESPRARGSIPIIHTPAIRVAPVFEKPKPVTISPSTETALLAILTSASSPGMTISAAYGRKEQEIRAVFAAVSVLEARELHRRLTRGAHGDVLSTQFARLSCDRRERLVAFLADARRREAVKQRAS